MQSFENVNLKHIEYMDVELNIRDVPPAGYPGVLSVPFVGTFSDMLSEPPLKELQMAESTARNFGNPPARVYGKQLFEWIFEGKLREGFLKSRQLLSSLGGAEPSARWRFRVRLPESARTLHELRWETLAYNKDNWQLGLETAFARCRSTANLSSVLVNDRPIRLCAACTENSRLNEVLPVFLRQIVRPMGNLIKTTMIHPPLTFEQFQYKYEESMVHCVVLCAQIDPASADAPALRFDPFQEVAWQRVAETICRKRCPELVIVAGTTDTSTWNLAQPLLGDVTGTQGATVVSRVNVGTAILTGNVPLANGGTAANLSATGGTGQFLKQSAAGAAITVGTIAAADLPAGSANYIQNQVAAMQAAGFRVNGNGIFEGGSLTVRSTPTVSTFAAEARPLNTVAGNTFVGVSAGAINTTGSYNTFVGQSAGQSNTTGSSNTFSGVNAGKNNNGDYNTFTGVSAGLNNTTGTSNTFYGVGTGQFNTTGNYNTFTGSSAGLRNSTGSNNTFAGQGAGGGNTTGNNNTFTGAGAGDSNTSGSANTFSGVSAGGSNTTGNSNTFSGVDAGLNNTTGFSNTFVGTTAGSLNTMGSYNTFAGESAGLSNSTGSYNTFAGSSSGTRNTTGGNNTFSGVSAGFSNTTGSNNTFSGVSAGGSNTNGVSVTAVGHNAGLSNTVENNNTFLGDGSNGAAGITNATALGSSATVTQSDTVKLGSAAALALSGMALPPVSPAGEVKMYFDSTANQLFISQNGGAYTTLDSGGAAGAGFYGSGNDGNITLSANTTLTRDMYYNNLTINAGVTVKTGGFRVFVKQTLTMNAGSFIQNNGGNGTNPTAGTGAVAGTLLGGANGGASGSGGTAGGTGVNSNNSCGGNGGAGGNYGGGGIGLAGTAVPVPISPNGGPQVIGGLSNGLAGRDLTNLLVQGGAGGGGGGSGGLGGSGGGGGGGGIVMVAAKLIVGTGAIQANGGNGGTTVGFGNSGGGGGGGGAVIVISSAQFPGGVVVTVNGGAPGGQDPAGTFATGGALGTVVLLTP